MVKQFRLIMLPFLLGLSIFALVGWVQDSSGVVTRPQLKSIMQQLGYDVKDLDTTAGKEKYSVVVVREGLDIPVGVELSGNSNYIWFTVNLGKDFTDAKLAEGMRSNAETQPSFLYVSKSGLFMMGLPVDNRGINNAIIRQRLDSIAANVVKTKAIWSKS